jgi:hypothetical protein
MRTIWAETGNGTSNGCLSKYFFWALKAAENIFPRCLLIKPKISMVFTFKVTSSEFEIRTLLSIGGGER